MLQEKTLRSAGERKHKSLFYRKKMKDKKVKKYTKETIEKFKKANKGENNPAWKGGRNKTKLGYIYIYSPEHPFRNIDQYVFEHRLIIEKIIGRYLHKKEEVHHINKIRTDNRPENLMLFDSKSSHSRFENGLNYVFPNEIIFDGRYYKDSLAGVSNA